MFGSTLITGASGLLGSELVKQLLENNEADPIICVVRDHDPRSRFFAEKMSDRVICVPGDIRQESLLTSAIQEYNVETVFHLAAQSQVLVGQKAPAETLDINIRGTWNLLEAIRHPAAKVKVAVVASSDKAYGPTIQNKSYREDQALNGRAPYDVSKSCCDLIAQAYLESYKLPIVITRCGNLFGPGDLNMDRLIPSTICSLLKNEAPVLRSNGKHVRDYLFLEDAAAAYRFLARGMLRKEIAPGPYNLSYGLTLSVMEVLERIARLMEKNIRPKVLDSAAGEILFQSLDSSKARALGWEPKFGFDEGLKKTIAWYSSAFPRSIRKEMKKVA